MPEKMNLPKIIKAKETMTSRERTIKTFQFEKTDRVNIGYHDNEVIHKRLMQAIGVSSDEELLQTLGVDYRAANPRYCGKLLFPEKEDRRVDWVRGYYTRWAEHVMGGYWDYCDFPLKDADDETIANFPVPSPDDFDYDSLAGKFEAEKDLAHFIGYTNYVDIINGCGKIMGMEDILCHLINENEAVLSFIDRFVKMELGQFERMLERYGSLIDFMWIGDDLGTQRGPMISLELYRKILRPRHQKYVDLAKSYNIPVLFHSCGSSSWVYEDFIEMGIRGVDTLQPEIPEVSPEYLKKHFKGRLCFHGCISTSGPLAFGTAEETRQVCRETLKTMMDGYGYIFAPTHRIENNTPVENIMAMYKAAHEFGVYT